MDNDYFTGYNDAIEDVQKEAAKLKPLVRAGIGGVAGGLSVIGVSSTIRSIREAKAAIAKAKKATDKKRK